MRYKYCNMHQERPKEVPEGCQYQIASGKWVKEEWPPHQWGGLLRRWPIPPVKIAGVVYEYYNGKSGYKRPSKIPEGCEFEDAFNRGRPRWSKETMSPRRWGGCRRRWPKSQPQPKVMDVPKLNVYVRKDKVTAIVNQIKDLLKQLE